MRRSRIPSADEAALWHNYVKDVAPLVRGPTPTPGPPRASQPSPPETPGDADAKTLPTAPIVPIRAPAAAPRTFEKQVTRRADRTGPVDIDRRSWQRLHRGEMVVEARLDLHGLTQMVAYDHLAAFVDHAWRVGTRCILVITGRGSGDVGILRTMTPRWLDEIPMRDKVLAYAQAKARHGGAGALYVLLKRQRVG